MVVPRDSALAVEPKLDREEKEGRRRVVVQ